MGRRGPLKNARPLGGAYLEAAAAAGARRRMADDADLLKVPSGLTAGAKRRWLSLAPLLLEDGRLRADTRETLVTYCRLADEADVIGEQLSVEGVVLKTPHGAIANPKSRTLAGIRSCLLRYSQAIGLDPVSKARLDAAGAIDARTPDQRQQGDELEQFLKHA